MPRSIQIAVPAELADALAADLCGIDGVIGLARQPGGALLPGDLLTIIATNDAQRHIFDLVGKHDVPRRGIVASSSLGSLLAWEKQAGIDRESNETAWEEIASLLRQDTNPGVNFLALMFLAGAVAAVGLWTDHIHLVLGAMVIAAAFEPLVRLPFGLITGLPGLALRGALACVSGYLMLFAGAALSTLVLRAIDTSGAGSVLETRYWIGYWSSFTPPGLFVSALGAAAGPFILCGLRSVLTTGVMITLALVPSMSVAGMALATADGTLAAQGLLRWAADAALVLLMSSIVLGLKQRLVHRRRTLA